MSIYEDDIDILYRLENHGWSSLYFFVKGEIHEIGITHSFSDPLVDLIEWCRAMVEGSEAHTIRFYDEPGTTWLTFQRLQEDQHVARISLCSSPDIEMGDRAPAKLLVEFCVRKQQLALQILLQLEKIALLCNDRNFTKHRGQFPHSDYRRLAGLIEKR